MSYAFRKVYADLVTADGSVCLVYLAWVRLLRRWHGRSGVELYGSDGARRVLRGGALPPLEREAFDGRHLELPLPQGPLVLDYAPEFDAYAPPPPEACPALRWAVLVPRAPARLWCRELGTLEGVGYVDWVELTRPTRRLGFRELCWGRAHVGGAAVAFTALDFTDGRSWRSGASWAAPSRAPDAAGGTATALDEAGDGEVRAGAATVALRGERLLHRGDAFGRERVAAPVDRWVARVLGGVTREVRWFGAAQLGGEAGRALWERVRFGHQAERP